MKNCLVAISMSKGKSVSSPDSGYNLTACVWPKFLLIVHNSKNLPPGHQIGYQHHPLAPGRLRSACRLGLG